MYCKVHRPVNTPGVSDNKGKCVQLVEYLSKELAPCITRHGVLLDIYGEGVMITGDSGVGKSESAIELIMRGHRLVADDAVEIRRVADQLIGTAPEVIRNYIELMRIRYTNDVDIRVEYPHDLPTQVSIPPLLLIVFVENAFKHGVSYNHPSFIRLKIEYADGQVTSTLTNSRHAAQSSKHPAGIGLENVRKRLELIYGAKNYSLEIREEEKTYTVKLVIPTLNA